MNDIQIKLKSRRKELKLTQKDVANTLGITQQTYQEIEAGKTKDMRVSTLKDICETLHISADYILGLTDNMIPMCPHCHKELHSEPLTRLKVAKPQMKVFTGEEATTEPDRGEWKPGRAARPLPRAKLGKAED